jgi:hypothetical protein
MNLCRCGKPNRDTRTVCDPCQNSLHRALGDVTWIDEEIDTTITRQRAAATTGGPASATTSLPWHERGAEARRHLHGILVSWVRLCSEEGVGNGPAQLPADRLPSLSRWLMWRLDGLAHHDAGYDAVEEITDAVAQCERIVFWKRRSRVYLGPCAYGDGLPAALAEAVGCPGDVYAEEGQPVGYCDDCERGVTVVVRQTELDRDLHARLLSAADIADWSVRMGLDAKREEVRKRVLYWHRHKRILAHGHEDRGETKVPLFRYGDVRLLLAVEYGSDTA